MKKIRVIISTFGPLHLTKSAEFLSQLVDVSIIQGWLPKRWNSWILTIVSKIVGRNLHKTFRKRFPNGVNKSKNYSVGLPEFILAGSRTLKVGNPLKLQIFAAKMFGRQSKKYIKNADIFHVRSGSGLSGAIETAKSNGMKVVVDHSIAHPAFMDKNLRDEYKKNGAVFELGLDNPFWRAILTDCEKADILLVNSQFVKDTFVAEGYNADKIRIAVQGVRKDFFGLKKSYGMDAKQPLKILFTGRFGFRKGAEYLLQALCQLDEKGIAYEMTVVGNCADSRPLLKKYSPKYINFVDTVPQDELMRYLSDADVYLFPSLCEGCASSGLEAMAAGLAVITTKESGLPIKNEENGLIVDTKDSQSIVNALIRLSENRSLIQDYGKAAAETISHNYTWEQYSETVVQAYADLMKE